MKKRLQYTDQEMIRGLVSYDRNILETYYRRYFESILYFVHINHGNEEDARDIFQDALMVLFQKVRDESFQLRCSLKTYLCSVTRILWLKELQKRKKIPFYAGDCHEQADFDADIIQIAEKNERINLFKQYFERMSSDCKQVILLFLDGKSISEITALMGYKNDQYTRNRRYRCKSWLINKIRNAYGTRGEPAKTYVADRDLSQRYTETD